MVQFRQSRLLGNEKIFRENLMATNAISNFFEKHLGAIVTSLVSLAAVIVSATQVWLAHINKEKELDLVRKNQNEQQILLDEESKRKWRLAMAEFVMKYESRIFSDKDEERNRMVDLVQATFPDPYRSEIFKTLVKVEATATGSTEEGEAAKQGRIEPWVQGKERIDAAQTEEAESVINSSDELIEKFKGPERRIFSDKLAELYDANKSQVVDVLISSILPDTDYWSYRVNIYIARTLEKIPSGWEGTDKQLEAVKQLLKTRNYKDATFKARVDRAISNYKESTSDNSK
jgi:hypothetical protein